MTFNSSPRLKGLYGVIDEPFYQLILLPLFHCFLLARFQQRTAEESDPEIVKCEAWQSMPEDDDNDESQSVPITVSLPAVDAGVYKIAQSSFRTNVN
jgi:hypothetical protein